MIIKGILKTIDYNNNSCTVRLPLFETSNSSGEVVLSAIFMNQPGMFNGYNEGDIVFVDFENNNLDTPVIIGKLYLGSEKEASNSQKGGLKVASLTVDSNATLPLDTKLVFNNTSSTEAPVDNRYANYKSLLDVIDALNKTEENISQVDKSISDGVITEIRVEYLSQVETANIPTVSDLNWQSTIPPLRNGYDIWQKTTCFNKRGQILGTPEIICLTSTSAVFTYWLKISTPVHTGTNQKEPIRITAMSKVGTHIETEDTTASLRWKWQSDATWNVKEENEKNKYTLTIPTKDCKDEDLLIEAYHNDISYASETITFIAQNGPTLDLTRDTAQIAYDSVGKTKLDLTSSVSSTAVLYFNGKQVQSAVDFSWTLNNCTASEGLKSPTITITDIAEASDEASATCTVVYAGTTCSKTFTVTKARQGNTPYNLLIENSYVSLGTNSNEELEIGWQNYTEHTISIYRNNGLISIPNDRIQIYNENIELPEEGLTLILKCENVEVDTQYKINDNHTISIKLSDFTAKTGSITYTLYDGSTAVATDTFNIVKIIPGAIGAAAKSYWLSMSTAVHTGTSQTSDIEVTARTKEGSEAEKTDTTAYLWYKFKTDSAWSLATDLNTDDEIKEHYKLIINADSIKDSDLEVLATHDNTFTPDENTTALSEEVYKFETITYSPLNTPVVDLSNDTDDLSYDASGATKIDNNEKVTSTAGLYLNGKEVTSNLAYVWTIPKGVTAVGDKTNTITVSSISDQSVKIRCTITIGNNGIDGKFGGRSYYKDFTVTKKLKGDKGDAATNYKLILSKNIIKAETLANSSEVIISLTETTGNSTTYSSTGTLWIAGSQVTVTEGKHHLTLPTDTSSYPIIVEWKINDILLDSAEISLLKDGNDGEPAVVKNAFCWSSNYEYIPATPNAVLDNSDVGTWEENKWYIYDGVPTIKAIPGSKIIFFSKRSGIESTINTAIWSKPEVFAVADEDAYNVINTAKGLFGYGQGVYYTYDPSTLTTEDLDGTTAPTKITINEKDYEKGKPIEASQIDIAKWIAKGNGEGKPLKSVENRKKVIKLYINAKYIQTGSLKVERDTNGQKETLFEAGLDNSTVKIGGFKVNGTNLSATIDTSSPNVEGSNSQQIERSFNNSVLTSAGITDITGDYISLTPTTIYCHDAGDLAALAIDQDKFNKIYKDADLLKRLETRPWIEFKTDTQYYICSYSNTITDKDNPINDIWDIYIYNDKTKTWEKDTSNQLITNVITHYKAQVYVGTDKIEVTNGDKIVKLQNGTLFANSADISGTITATAGSIGGFKLQDKGLVTQHLSEDDIVPLVSWLGTPLADKKIWDATLPASENTFTVSKTTISGWEIKYIYYDDYNKDAPTTFDATGAPTEEQIKNKLTLYLVVAINNQTTQTYKFKTTITDYSIWERKELNDVTTNQQFIATKIPVNTSNTNLATTRLSPDEIFIGYEKEINPGYDSDYWFTLTPEMIETSVGPTADKSDTQLYIDIFKKPDDPGTGTPWDTLYFNPNNNIYINKSKLTLELGYNTTTSGFVHIDLPSIGGGGSLIERPGTDIGITPPPDIGITPTPKPFLLNKPTITPDESIAGGGSLADSLATSTVTKTVYQCFNIIQIDAKNNEITWQSTSENTSIKTRYKFPYKLKINGIITEVEIPLVVKVPKKDSYVKAEASGALTATNASISGNLQAEAGKIGGFEIYENGLYSDFIELSKKSLVLAGGNFTLKADSTSNTGESISLNTSFNSSPAIIFSGNGSIIDQTGSVGLRFKAGESKNTIKYRAVLYATDTTGIGVIGGTNYITITIQAEEKNAEGKGTNVWKQFALQKDKTFTVYHKGWDIGEQIKPLTITLKAGEYTKTVGVSGYWMFYGASWTSTDDFIKNTDVINNNYFEQYEVVPASLYAVSSILPQSTGTTSGTISVYYNTSYGPPVNTYRYEGTRKVNNTDYYVWSGNYGATGHPTVYYTKDAPGAIKAVSDVANNNDSTTLYYNLKDEKFENSNEGSKSSMYISSKSITITSGCSLGLSTAKWDAVYATELNADKINAKELNADKINAKELNADKIKAKYLNSEELTGKVVNTDSDLRLKQNINYDISKYDKLFDSLKPASYQFKSDSNPKTHLGFIAQEVEQSLFDNNLTRKDFAGVTIYGEGFDEKTDTILNLNKTTYALGYNELHALEVRQIQLLKARVQELEEKIEQLSKNK